MIDEQLSKTATFEDGVLLKAVHPVGSTLLTYIGGKWRLKKIPFVGTIISDASLIREVFMDKKRFSKDGEGASTSFWNPIIGNYGLLNMDGEEHIKLKRAVSNMFAKERVELIYKTVSASILDEATEKLKAGDNIDMVSIAEEISYLSMWHIVGLSAEKLHDIDFKLAVRTLRSVTEGVNPAKKKLSNKQVTTARGKLVFLEELARDAYNNDDRESIPLRLKQEGYSEEAAISLTKSLFIAGTETVISFLPRMAALFIKTRYIDYLSEHPEHVTKGVEEALRVTVPTPVAVRSVVEDTSFHGVKLKAGERLVLSTIAASKRFGDFNPFNEVDKEIRGLWFGAGVHMCIGVGIALVQAETVGRFLAAANADKKLEILSQASDDKGHTGSYKGLIISCARL
jgi:cytochrome P450